MSSLPGDYERIIRPIEQQIMRSVWRITQNAEDADDAFQEAMTQIWQRLPRIRAHSNPPALVLRICTNVACDVVRRKSRRDHREQSRDAAGADTSAPNVAALILNNERREQVQAAIARLPEQQATAITMRFLLYCPYEEIALALECAEATARVHVTRGLSRLRDLLAHLRPLTDFGELIITRETEFDPTARLLADTLNTDPPSDVKARMRTRLDSLRTRMESPTVARSDRHFQPRRWFAGATALAAVSAAVLLAIVLLPIDSSPALAQIVEAVAAKTWLHASGTGPDGQSAEMWFSARKGILAWHVGESFLFVDQAQQTMDVFGKPAASDSVQRMPLEHVPLQGIDAARQSFLALLTGDLQQAMKAGDQQVLEHKQQTIVVDGRRLIEHRFVVGRKGQNEPRTESLLQVDPQTGLPISWEMKLGDQSLFDFKVSYPDRGPLTIVALGVPETAPIIDQTPRGEFKAVLVATNAARRRFDDYHAVVIDSPTADRAGHGTWCRIWRKGNCWRIDRGHRMFHKNEVPPQGVDAEAWWLQKAKSMRSYPREIWDGKRLWTFEPNFPNPRGFDPVDPHAVAIDSLTATSRVAMDPGDPMSNSGVILPEYYGYESLKRGASLGFRAETRSDKLNDIPMTLVDIINTHSVSPKSTSRERYWLDPQRGNMIVRKEQFLVSKPDQASGASEVVTAARTPQGLWYPTTVRQIGNSVSLEDNSRSDWYDRYYLEFNTEIPDELFNAESVDTKTLDSAEVK